MFYDGNTVVLSALCVSTLPADLVSRQVSLLSIRIDVEAIQCEILANGGDIG